jgi:hypothetical protein
VNKVKPVKHNPDSESFFEKDVCAHIFTVSAAMVGVCLTVIGILRVVITIQKVDTLADDLLALDAVLFLAACLLSYWALRSRGAYRMHRIERIADSIFILALLLMVVICGFIVYAVAIV